MPKAKLTFRDDCRDDLPVELQAAFDNVKALYNAHKDAAKALPTYKAHKDAQTAFQAAVIKAAELPVGKTLVFGYNYGKLGIAVKDAPKSKAKAGSQLDLNSWFKMQTNSGAAI